MRQRRLQLLPVIAIGLTAMFFSGHLFSSREGDGSTPASPTGNPLVSLAAVSSTNNPKSKIQNDYGRLPLSFEANQGQTDARVRFLARCGGYTIFLTNDEAVLTLRKSQPSISRSLKFGPPDGLEPFASVGSRAGWSGLPDDWKSRGRSLIPDLSQLVPEPSAGKGGVKAGLKTQTPHVVRMRFVGHDAKGRVVGLHELPGRSNYFIGNDRTKWRTNVPNYSEVKFQSVYPGIDLVYYGNQSQLEYDLVVAPGADPNQIKLSFAGADGMCVDAANGDLVLKVGGDEVRLHKPAVFQPAVARALMAGGSEPTALSKLDARSGSWNRESRALNPKAFSGAFVLANNNLVAFRVPGYDPKRALVIDPVLSYSTYLGGSGYESGQAIAVDGAGNAYVTGDTASADFPTAGLLQPSFGSGTSDAFVAKLNAAGSALVYSTYLGGSFGSWGTGIAVDSFGNAYVAGNTTSTDFPTANPFQAINKAIPTARFTAFIAKLNAAGTALVYSTYLGGSLENWSYGIAVDSSGNAYVTGSTFSDDFPTMVPLQAINKATPKTETVTAFVAKLTSTGSALVYSTYLGGSEGESGQGIAVDSFGNAYVTGYTSSSDFPTANPMQASDHGDFDAFVAKLNPAGSALVYSTYLGGSGGNFSGDQAYGIAVDPSGGAYVTGSASSTNFPTTAGAFQTTLGAQGDGFVAKISPGVGAPLVNLSPTSLTFGPQDLGTSSAPETVVFTNTGNTLLTVPSIVASAEFGQTNTCGGSVGARGNCTISVTFTPTGILSRTGTLTISDNAANSPQTIALSGLGVMPVVLLPASLNFGNQAQNATSPPQTITLLSNQTTPQAISVTTSGNFAQSNTCGGSVPPWSRCTISVTFTPSILGVEAGALTVTDAASNIQQTASLSGTGVLPAALNPTSLNFGGQAENTTSPPQTLILTNSQSTPLAISSVTTNGDFAQTNTCGSSVPATSSCTISVTYTPSSLGVETGTLTVTDGASNSSQTASLAGRGLLQAQLSTPSVAFAAQTVGTTSPAWNVLLGNNLTTALPISITFTGADPGDFAQTNTCGASLAPKSTCTISLTFTPTATGTRTATLTVTDSANNSPQTMALSGTGD